MLAGVRNVAWGAAMALAGFLAVTSANCAWIILFFSDAGSFFFGPWFYHYRPQVDPQDMESLLAVAVVIWLIACAIRRASRSISARRS